MPERDPSQMTEQTPAPEATEKSKPQEDFEVGEHQIPWFLWVFFILVICWASVAWIPLFGY